MDARLDIVKIRMCPNYPRPSEIPMIIFDFAYTVELNKLILVKLV